MDTLLVVITGLSMLMATAATTVAWRVVRADRRRTAARVAALAAAAGVGTVRANADATRDDGSAEAAIPTVREVPSGRHEFVPARSIAAVTAPTDTPSDETTGAIFVRPAVDSGSSGRQHRLLAGAAAFAVVLVAGVGVLFVSGRTPGPGVAPARTPLELVALGHDRTDGQLAVQGVVRYPGVGASISAVDAEVRVFDAAGLVIANRSVRIAAVGPGQDVPFVVPLGDMPAAARYRVSFTSEGSMLPHVDRRTNLPAAVTAEAR